MQEANQYTNNCLQVISEKDRNKQFTKLRAAVKMITIHPFLLGRQVSCDSMRLTASASHAPSDTERLEPTVLVPATDPQHAGWAHKRGSRKHF
eukprot:5706680-Amphidinium_carterae.1